MPSHADLPLGFRTALRTVELGRAAFFGSVSEDLPADRSAVVAEDDLLPQFGYVGSRFTECRVLLLGINPGNGPDAARTSADEVQMPALHRFTVDRTPESFAEAQRAYQCVCEFWPMWRRHCSEVIGAGRLSMDDIAYSNCLPWRTSSKSAFSETVALNAAQLYAYPLIEELKPRVVVAMGKRAAKILATGRGSISNLIVWNRAQAATVQVRCERADTARKVLALVGRIAQ